MASGPRKWVWFGSQFWSAAVMWPLPAVSLFNPYDNPLVTTHQGGSCDCLHSTGEGTAAERLGLSLKPQSCRITGICSTRHSGLRAHPPDHLASSGLSFARTDGNCFSLTAAEGDGGGGWRCVRAERAVHHSGCWGRAVSHPRVGMFLGCYGIRCLFPRATGLPSAEGGAPGISVLLLSSCQVSGFTIFPRKKMETPQSPPSWSAPDS